MRLQGQAQSKGLLINLPHQRPHQPILQQATSFPLNLPYTSHPTSLLPPPAPLMVNEPSSNSGGKSSPSNSLLLGEGNVFGSSSLPSPNAHNLLDFGMFSSSSLGRQSIGILGLDLPLPSADSASNHHRDENQGKSEVQWPGQDDEGNDDGDDECGSRPAIELVVEGRAIDLEKERIIAAAEADLQPPESSAPSFLAPPPLLPPSSDLGGSLMLGMGISGVAVNSGSEPSDKALSSPTVPFPGFSS